MIQVGVTEVSADVRKLKDRISGGQRVQEITGYLEDYTWRTRGTLRT
jgi:hypothetical protein